MHRTQSVHTKLDGEIILRESPVDPVVDLPVKEMVSLVWEEGTSSSNASVDGRSGCNVICTIYAFQIRFCLRAHYERF